MPEWDGLLPPVSCGERPIIDGVRTPVAYSMSVHNEIRLPENRRLVRVLSFRTISGEYNTQ